MIILTSSAFFQAYNNSDIFGKLIFWGLLILSIISWILMVYKVKIINRSKRESSIFEKIFDEKKEKFLLFNTDDISKTLNPYFVIYSSLKEKTLKILNKNRFFAEEKDSVYLSSEDITLIESSMDAKIAMQEKFLFKNLFVLSTIITLAPFLGLLGTVWGILITFSNLQDTNINNEVLNGISMALATTVFGLMVAIPAVIAYNYLKNKIREFIKEMFCFSNLLITNLEIQYRKVEKK
ncbi:MAG: hypothetical protein AMS24_02915 [Chlamydiae bacterium SM23_39]|nr:MAG: hypothetical protein AMS24_02915 [Chlamydiae bacterium SM23_39]